jgi:wyosine [tRNA(Phe)-imidazoG37] synthetase (radical SAM superfamily)
MIIDEFRREYARVKGSLDVVTITGSGEPTLNRNLAEIARRIKEISSHPLALLTNSTTLTDQDVRDALMLFDIIVPSLDAASQDVFEKINRPAPELDIEEINKALISFSGIFQGRIFIEVLLVKGINDSKEEMAKIAEIIRQCRYDLVQVNTVFRPPAYSGTEGLNEDELIEAFLYFKNLGLKVEPAGNFLKTLSGGTDENLENRISSLLRMRPCTVKDIASVFGAPAEKVSAVIDRLMNDSLIDEKIFKNEKFYFGKTS